MDPLTAAVILVSAYALGTLLAPKPKSPKPSALSDFEIPTAEEGRAIPVIFGTVTVKGPNVTWYGDLRRSAVKTKSGK
jgi:uncharacterized protein (DUF2062 family)